MALDEAIRLDPKYVWAFAERGRVHFDRRDYHRAIGNFDRAVALDPKYKWAYVMHQWDELNSRELLSPRPLVEAAVETHGLSLERCA